MSEDVETLLRGMPVFRALDPADRRRVAGVSRLAEVPKGGAVFVEGDQPECLSVLLKGRVKVVKSTPSGKGVILEIASPGDPLGAVAVYEGRAFPASAVALEPVTVLRVPRSDFYALLDRHPSLVRGLLAGLTLRLVELTGRVADLSGGRVEPRFARLFLRLSQEHGAPGRGGTFVPMPLSRQELADMTGTTIETAIRIMSRWGKQRIVLTERDGFVVIDAAELETLALA